MLRNIAMMLAAGATFAMSATALADHGWWDDANDDNYRTTEYEVRDTGYNGEYVYAEVLDVAPIYRYVQVRTPQQECWDERVQVRPRQANTAVATVTGGVIGGAIGRQFGGGDGRDALTILGALIGSAVAHDGADRRNREDYYYDQPRIRTVERCTTRYTSHEERRLEGYHVTYIYAGQRYMTRTARHPGDRIRVRVAVTPVEGGRY